MNDLPDLSKESFIVIDCETDDPGLTEKGSNAIHRARGGSLLGYAVYAPGGYCRYHQHEKDSPTARWLADQIRRTPLLTNANLKYDLLWLLSEGIWDESLAKRRYGDCLLNAALLDENARHTHNLNAQAILHDLPVKKNDKLLAVAPTLGIKDPKRSMAFLQQHAPEVVAEYAEHDALLAGQIYQKQLPLLKDEGLERVLEIEELLLPILVLMEAQGARVDLEHTKQLAEELTQGIEIAKTKILSAAGRPINFNPSGSLKDYLKTHHEGRLFYGGKKNDVKCGDADLEHLTADPVVEQVLKARKLSKMLGTFVKGYVLDKHVNGRLYPSIWQLAANDESKGDAKAGTITGRFSYSKPNLQNIPVRNEEYGKRMRAMFCAEPGKQLISSDISQQEPRWMMHWAVLWGIKGAKEAAQTFKDNPDADWHSLVAGLIGGPEYRTAGKEIVLARAYCAGFAKLAKSLQKYGISVDDVPALISKVDDAFPFVPLAAKAAENFALKNGYVRTWSGRKGRFHLWEPKKDWNNPKQYAPCLRSEAEARWPGKPLVRAYSYTAFNKIIQGSSADQTKLAIIRIYHETGIVPNIQIHDELVFQNVDEGLAGDQFIEYTRKTMIDVIKLEVPVKVGITKGRVWQK